MSAVPVMAPPTMPRPVQRPRQRAESPVAARRQSNVMQVVLMRSMLFGLLVAIAYGASSLAGQTIMEQARREGIRSQERARQAKMDVAVLRQRVDRLSSFRAIESWALSHGMTQQNAVRPFAHEGTKVAKLP